MRLVSTIGHGPAVGFRDALVGGLAPDGGLFLPLDWPTFTRAELEGWRDRPFADLGATLARRLLADELPVDVIDRLAHEAFDFPVPTVRVEDRRFVLELFHGPTLAFKDFGARFLARVFSYLIGARGDHATILVATSGDTGSAVAHAFFRVPGVRVVVLYPAGNVSRFQEAQMATLGENVRAVRVPGSFDDCQRLVKSAFMDDRLTTLNLSSANSINIGRLLPQVFYFVAGYLAVAGREGQPIVFSVPSGNLGNLTAGVMAERLGVPVRRFVAATNANAVLPEYLSTGVYRARPSVRTVSNAMDVGDPSNFTRLLALSGGSWSETRRAVWSVSIDEEETRRCIRDVYARTAYVLDPHGAVGYAAASRYAAEEACDDPIVTLATAHPAKFADVVKREVGFEPELPEPLRDWASRPLLATDLRDVEYETFREFLRRRDEISP